MRLPASREMMADAVNARSRRSTIRRRLPALLAVFVVIGTGAWFARMPLLRTAADFWIVSDPVGPADAVAVFGGGLEDRPFAAAAYYRQGLVKKVLISNHGIGQAEQLAVVMSDVAANHAVLLELGVPQSVIETFGSELANTHEEVLALRDWAQREGAHSIIVPTEIFSARRVRWMLHRAFGDKIVILVPALDPQEYRRDDWWQHGQGVSAFHNEVSKYIYYWLRY